MIDISSSAPSHLRMCINYVLCLSRRPSQSAALDAMNGSTAARRMLCGRCTHVLQPSCLLRSAKRWKRQDAQTGPKAEDWQAGDHFHCCRLFLPRFHTGDTRCHYLVLASTASTSITTIHGIDGM